MQNEILDRIASDFRLRPSAATRSPSGGGEEKKTEKKSRPSRDPPGRENPLGSRRSCRSRFLSNDRPIDRVWNRSIIGRHGGNDADRGSAYCSSFSLLCRYLCYPLPLCSGHRGTWGGCDFDDARRHPSREPRDVIDSLEAALTFDLRLELVHLRFYRVSQFCNRVKGETALHVSLSFVLALLFSFSILFCFSCSFFIRQINRARRVRETSF